MLVLIDPGYNYVATGYRTSVHTVGRVLDTLTQQSVGRPLRWRDMPDIADGQGVFVGYLMLDALVGNTDRHHKNWGVLRSSVRTDSNLRPLFLAPTFDHASSLGRNETESARARRLNTRDRQDTVEAYAERAPSGLYSDDNAPIGPFDAFRLAATMLKPPAISWLQALESLPVEVFRTILNEVPPERLSRPANDFAYRLLVHNRHRLLSVRQLL